MAGESPDNNIRGVEQSPRSRPIRICLAVRPDLTRELLRNTFEPYGDIEVIESADGNPPAKEQCDVVVALASAPVLHGGEWLDDVVNGRRENLVMLTIDGALIMIFEIRSHQRLTNPSSEALIAAVRDAVAATPRRA